MRFLAAILAVPAALRRLADVERPFARAAPAADRVGRLRAGTSRSTARASGASCSTRRAREGEVQFDASGMPGAEAVPHPPDLRAAAGVRRARASHRELDCLRHVDWNGVRSAAASPRRCYAARVRHDLRRPRSWRTRATTPPASADEATTNCFAIQAMAWTATQLGAPVDEAELLARAMEALEPEQAVRPTRRPSATAGRRLDLHPETSDFPTEHRSPPLGARRHAEHSPGTRAERTARPAPGRVDVACRRRGTRHYAARDPRQRRHPHPRPVAADVRRARDRRAARRRWRRHARVGAPDARARRPRRPLRAARVHRLARPLPDLGARAPRRPPRGGRLGRGRARARRGAPAAGGTWIRGTGLARRGLARARRRPRRSTTVTGDDPGRALVEGLPLALAQQRRPRPRGRRSRRAGRRRRARRRTARRPGSSARSRPGASASASSTVTRGRVGRGDARGHPGRERPRRRRRSTTRTAGSAPPRSSAGSTSTRGCRCASGSRSRPTGCPSSRRCRCAPASATTSSASAT